MSPTESRSLSTEEKIIVALACLIALSFFLFLPRSCQMGATALNVRNFIPDGSSDELAANASALALSKQLDEQRALLAAQESQLAASLAETEANAKRSAIARAKGQVSSQPRNLRSIANLGSQKNRLGVPEASLATAAAAYPNQSEEDLKKLGSALDRRTREIAKQEEILLAQKERLNKQGQQLTNQEQEIANLQASNKQEQDGFQRAQSNLQSENQTLKERLAELEKQLGTSQSPGTAENGEGMEDPASQDGEEGAEEEMPAPDEEEKTTSETGEAESKKETESSFAESEADLDDARKNLVLAIRDMESLRGSDLDSRYKELESSLKANSLARINFSSGKSDLKSSEAAKIVALAQKVNPDSKFLIAGFADMSGTKAGNATLSSARAKVAANSLGEKVGYDKVSAIYLGQTARFGKKSENRVVEIWELKASE